MENITRMKNALETFMKTATATFDEMERADKVYQAEPARNEKTRLYEALREKKTNALNEIEAATAAGKEKAETWARLDGAKITPDAELLKVYISPEQFDELAKRYKSNATMIHLLAQYGKEQNEKNGVTAWNNNEKRYNVEALPSLEKKTRAYDAYHDWAVRLISSLFDNPKLPIVRGDVERFGVYMPGDTPLLDEIR